MIEMIRNISQINTQYYFQPFQTTKSFVDSVFNGKISISGTDQKESNLLQNTLERNSKVKSKSR